MAFKKSQSICILEQGKVKSVIVNDFDTEYNLLGFCKEQSVFESVIPMQEQKRNSDLISKQIIIKTTSNPNGIVLINNKNMKIAVKSCRTIPKNVLQIINNKNYENSGSVTDNLKRNDTNESLTLTKRLRTYEKKKDKPYQNANTDNILLTNADVRRLSLIEEVEDISTNHIDKTELSEHLNKTTPQENHKLNFYKVPVDNIKVQSERSVIKDYLNCSPERENSDNTQTQNANEAFKETPEIENKSKTQIENIKKKLNSILTPHELKNSNEKKLKVTLIPKLQLPNVITEKIAYDSVNSTINDEVKEDNNLKVKVNNIFVRTAETIENTKTDMGKIKHFKEKSCCIEDQKIGQNDKLLRNEFNIAREEVTDGLLYAEPEGELPKIVKVNKSFILPTLKKENFKNTDYVHTVILGPNNLMKVPMDNKNFNINEIKNQFYYVTKEENIVKPIEYESVNKEGNEIKTKNTKDTENKCSCNNSKNNINETVDLQNTTIKTNLAKNKKIQRTKTLNKQLFVQREIEKYMRTTMNRTKRKLKMRNNSESTTISSKTKDTSCQTNIKPETSDTSTQTELIEELYTTEVEYNQQQQTNNSVDVKSDIFEMILTEDNPIVGANVSFGVGPKIQPCVFNSGRTGNLVCDGIMGNNQTLMANNFNGYTVQSPVTFEMGYTKVNNIYTNSNAIMNEKEIFHKYLKECSQQDSAGNLPLHIEVMNNNLEEVKKHILMLRLRNISIDSTNTNNLTPLHLAIIHNCDVGIVHLLLRNADLSCTDSDGNNAIHLAVFYNSIELLEVLLEKASTFNLNLNTFNYEGFSPLLLATLEDKYEMVDMFLRYGADANVRDQKSGRTPLFHAVENDNLQMVKLLLKNGANKKTKNFSGTSTHDAVFELENINPEIKNTIIGKDVFAINSTRNDKRKKVTQKPSKCVCPKKLKTVKTYKKIKLLTE